MSAEPLHYSQPILHPQDIARKRAWYLANPGELKTDPLYGKEKTEEVVEKKVDERLKFFGLGVVTGALITMGLVKMFETTPQPIVIPQPIPEPTPSATPFPTEIPTVQPTPTQLLPTPTATPEPAPVYNYNNFWNPAVIAAGEYPHNKIAKQNLEFYPEIAERPNMRNDLAMYGADLWTAQNNVTPAEAFHLPPGFETTLPGKEVMDVGKACLEGVEIPYAPEMTSEICPDIYDMTGSDLNNPNNNIINPEAIRVNQMLEEEILPNVPLK